ncbi:MAG TPA: hypothetical protein VJL84_04335, partial [Kiloniellales bacterium]|nr:hypothetical protein [Kiloniellales bacterium]
LILALLAALPARAETSTVLTALEQIPADPALWAEARIVDVVDVAALKQVSGVAQTVRFTDFAGHKLSEPDELAATSLLWRLQSSANFVQYALTGAETWPKTLGVDFFQLDWFTEAGTPPQTILLLGGAALPRGEGLVVLQGAGLQPVQRQGVIAWAKGEQDNGQDLMSRDPGFPFWGWLGMSVRLFRGEDALVGARSWVNFDLALAVERGEADSLADLPRFRLAAEAAGHADYSAGPILQMTFLDQALGEGPIAPDPQGLPPYDLLAFADREDASGHQLVLVLSYGADAETAAAVAARLPDRFAAYRDKGGKGLAERFPGLGVETTALETDNGAAVVAVLSLPPLPVEAEGKVLNRSPLYGHFLRMLWNRDLGFLAPRA